MLPNAGYALDTIKLGVMARIANGTTRFANATKKVSRSNLKDGI